MFTKPCTSCGAQIIWIRTPGGKSMPCDLKPVSYINAGNGKERVVTPNGQVISCNITEDILHSEGYGYIPHWSTCKNPDKFRKKK